MARNWAITIGINGYRFLSPLNYAVTDADAVRQFFSEDLGFHQVYHFTDSSQPIAQDRGPALISQPTGATLRRFLRTRFEEPFLRDGDNLWFFFAGHGIRHENRDYLMPQDGDRGDLKNSAIPLHYISERLRRSGADNVILLIDACRSDKEGRRDGFGFGAERQQGVITIFSCSPEEPAYEIEELQQGAFTHALLESLRLEGEGNCATVERLYQRLRYTVPQLTLQYKRVSQTPYGVIEPPSKIHLILLPQEATQTDVVALKNDALMAELNSNLMTARQLWIRVSMVSPGDPEAIAGIERLSRGTSTPLSEAPDPTPPSSSSNTSGSRRVEAPVPQSPPSVQPTYRVERLDLPAVPPKTVNASTPQNLPTFEFEVVKVDANGNITQREQRKAKYLREFINSVVLDLVLIPRGRFQMGSASDQGKTAERPQHEVSVNSFLMGKYLVTQDQWRAVSTFPKVGCDLRSAPSYFKRGNRPVEGVSWDDAEEFCKRLSKHTKREYRLPSEAEWEYACRARTTSAFYFGEKLTPKLAQCKSNLGMAILALFSSQTAPVGSFSANAFGLYDMHGNVWEWCQDYWHENYQGAPTDGSAWVTGGEASKRLLRGGSWSSHPGVCRSANRNRYVHTYLYNYVGFRVVCASS
jgi:formylglycine-generating enzyme required for sulfatase activity/uncharacterized caspase-like protein